VTDKKARVDLMRCIGCGLCVVTCKAQAITLQPRDRQTVPPADSKALYTKILFQRYGPLRILGKAAGMITGGKF
jgi:electron transport complex protein RnfB